jgi:hypothetical protein
MDLVSMQKIEEQPFQQEDGEGREDGLEGAGGLEQALQEFADAFPLFVGTSGILSPIWLGQWDGAIESTHRQAALDAATQAAPPWEVVCTAHRIMLLAQSDKPQGFGDDGPKIDHVFSSHD